MTRNFIAKLSGLVVSKSANHKFGNLPAQLGAGHLRVRAHLNASSGPLNNDIHMPLRILVIFQVAT
jgi:hypothetical protein